MRDTGIAAEGLDELDAWATTLLASLEPRERTSLLQRIGRDLRKANAKRITRQIGPDGKRWAPRKKRKRTSGGPRQRAKMLLGLRKARHMKVRASTGGVSVGFDGPAARIARVHHYGLRERLKGSNGKAGPLVRFSQRQLLGLAAADRDAIQSELLDHITPEGRS